MDQIKKAGATEILKHVGPQMLEHFPALSLTDWGKRKTAQKKDETWFTGPS